MNLTIPSPFTFFLSLSIVLLGTATQSYAQGGSQSPKSGLPNIVLIYADDLGYGDLGCYGATKWKTPRLDQLASQGVRFTDFHVTQPVCSASRASLLTGCYANRIGIHGALFPKSTTGIHASETTIAEMLRPQGYATGIVGKWHLGHQMEFLPLQHGFDSYLGLPYSNDMWPSNPNAAGNFPKLPLFRDNTIIDDDVSAEDQSLLTAAYRDFSTDFIRTHAKQPFFLYFAHTFPHVPLYAGERFRGRSGSGVYGDVIEEFDSAVGTILDELEAQGLTDNTLVLFSSDNGPWLLYGDHGGEAGPWREGKGTVFEGGIRVPMIGRWPGHIPPGIIQDQLCSTMDVLPTLARIVDTPLPKTKIDGKDIFDLLTGVENAKGPHDALYFYYGVNELQAIRSGPWKLLLPHQINLIEGGEPGVGGQRGRYNRVPIDRPQLFNLSSDPGERMDLAQQNQKQLAIMLELVEKARSELGDSLVKRTGTENRAPGSTAPSGAGVVSPN